MGFLFGRKGRNETHGRRGEVAKKSAALLAAVAVAGGSAVVGMPAAEAAVWGSALYFEKSDESGNSLGGSVWKIQYEEFSPSFYEGTNTGTLIYHTSYVVDNFTSEDSSEWFNRYKETDLDWEYEFLKNEYGIDDKSLVYGEDAYPEAVSPLHDPDEFKQLQPVQDFIKNADTSFQPDNWRDQYGDYWSWGSLSPEGLVDAEMEHLNDPEFVYTFTEVISDLDDLPGRIKSESLFGVPYNANLGSADPYAVRTSDIRIEEVVSPKGYGTCDPTSEDLEATLKIKDYGDYERVPEIESVTSTDSLPFTGLDYDGEPWGNGVAGVYAVANFTNCSVPEPTSVTETVTETPEPSTTIVTPPTTTVTLPSTVTTTMTPPATTVTETPKTETATATTTESATTTVTETPKTETVTETPERETVTHTPNRGTAPQVTVTETPKQVTETTTLPQKTVTEQVPTTVVKDKTETVKVPPVTVTETEKQEPTTVRETVTETPKQPVPDVPAVVEQPTPNAPVVDTPDTPVIPGAFSGTVVWDEDRSKHVNDGDERIPGLTVVAYKDGKEIARTTTDENGFYKFDNLEPGEYGIAVYGPDGGELFFEDKAATVVAGEEDTGNDWGFVREDAPAPAPEKPATPVETVRQTLATTGANSYALAGLGAVLATLVALAVVSRRKVAHQ